MLYRGIPKTKTVKLLNRSILFAKAGEVLWKVKSKVCVITQISPIINNTYLYSLTFTWTHSKDRRVVVVVVNVNHHHLHTRCHKFLILIKNNGDP